MLKPLSMYADLKIALLKLRGKIPINPKLEQFIAAKFVMDSFTFVSFTLEIIEWFRKVSVLYNSALSSSSASKAVADSRLDN